MRHILIVAFAATVGLVGAAYATPAKTFTCNEQGQRVDEMGRVSIYAGDCAKLKDNWRLSEQKDDFTDEANYFATLSADNRDYGYSQITAKPESIAVRCNSDKFDIYVNAGFLGGDSIPVRYRFDDAPPISERWTSSTDNQSAFLPGSYRDFRNGLKTANKVVIELTDFRGSTGKATFTLGARDNMLKVYEACGK